MLLKVFLIFVITTNVLVVVKSRDADWWQHAEIYQIYPRSFKDSDGDGIGDLNGITSKLTHLKDIGVNCVWMSPIFASPQVDVGYDVSNYLEIDSTYGTMEDFKKMLQTMKSLDIKILLDFVPNHSSSEHEWFIKSKARDPKYENYYVWHDGEDDGSGKKKEPNNWLSVFGTSAWTWDDDRQQYYLHQFAPEQPDLNYREQQVIEEMKNVLRFWLEMGADGFRFDAINHLYEAEGFPDEPVVGDNPNDYGYLDHIYTKDVEGVFDIVYDWRKLLDEWKTEHGGETRIFMTEAYANLSFTMKYYEDDVTGRQGAHMPFNFGLLWDLNANSDSFGVRNSIATWLENMPQHHTPDFVLGSHDHSRVGSRVGEDRIDLANIILMTLPGVSITYYGEEIGMVDNKDFITTDDRDPNRTPMQWDRTTSGGFSNVTDTWLPVHSNYVQLNVEAQNGVALSHLEIYKSLTALRNQPSLVYGDYFPKILSSNVFAYVRELKDEDLYVTVVNFGTTTLTVDLTSFINLPNSLIVEVMTSKSTYKIGQSLETDKIQMAGPDAIILKGLKSFAPVQTKMSLLMIVGIMILTMLRI